MARVRDGQVAVADPENTFLGAQDAEGFEELVGLRLSGMPSAVLTSLKFQPQALPGIQHARESLSSWLTNPPQANATGRFAAPPGRIAVVLPRANEAIPAFLKAARAGRENATVVLDPDQIRIAFDFRGHNPSAIAALKQAGTLRSFVLRTVEGHVLVGKSRSLGGRHGNRFVALADVSQLMPHGRLRLPEIIVEAEWIGLWADITEDAARAAANNWTPFMAAEANPEIVLGIPAAATAPVGPGARAPGGVLAG